MRTIEQYIVLLTGIALLVAGLAKGSGTDILLGGGGLLWYVLLRSGDYGNE